MGHVNGRTEKTDVNVNAHHMAEQARLKAIKQLLDTAQHIRNFRSVESFKIARELENDANTLNNPFATSNQTTHPPAELKFIGLALVIVMVISAILFNRARKNT